MVDVNAVVGSLVSAWNSGDIRRIGQVYAEDARLVHPMAPMPLEGRAAIEQFEGGMFAAFSAIEWKAIEAFGSGDRVAVEWQVSATHTAEMPTPNGPLPATGRRIVIRGESNVRVRPDGRLAEERRFLDGAALFAQLTG
jgi:uncharacterized protein (TIGR02246 family)